MEEPGASTVINIAWWQKARRRDIARSQKSLTLSLLDAVAVAESQVAELQVASRRSQVAVVCSYGLITLCRHYRACRSTKSKKDIYKAKLGLMP